VPKTGLKEKKNKQRKSHPGSNYGVARAHVTAPNRTGPELK